MNAHDVIDRVKKLQEFTVITDRPEELCVIGAVPFHLHINDKELTATILAESFEEAAEMLHEWLYGELN